MPLFFKQDKGFFVIFQHYSLDWLIVIFVFTAEVIGCAEAAITGTQRAVSHVFDVKDTVIVYIGKTKEFVTAVVNDF